MSERTPKPKHFRGFENFPKIMFIRLVLKKHFMDVT